MEKLFLQFVHPGVVRSWINDAFSTECNVWLGFVPVDVSLSSKYGHWLGNFLPLWNSLQQTEKTQLRGTKHTPAGSVRWPSSDTSCHCSLVLLQDNWLFHMLQFIWKRKCLLLKCLLPLHCWNIVNYYLFHSAEVQAWMLPLCACWQCHKCALHEGMAPKTMRK